MIVRAKRGVCNVTSNIVCCREDANNFKNIVAHFGGQNHQFGPLKYHFRLKMVILTPKMGETIFEIICILTAVKNRTSNIADTPFGPDY